MTLPKHTVLVTSWGNKLVVNLVDNKGNAIADADVNVLISEVSKTIRTDANGQATLAISNAPGTYNAVITYANVQKTAKISGVKPRFLLKNKTFFVVQLVAFV